MPSKLIRIIAVGALFALGCLGMKYRTEWWAAGIVTTTVLVYLVAIVTAIVTTGRNRAAASAFVAVGGVYFLLSLVDSIRALLLTNHALALLWTWCWNAAIFIPSNTREIGVFGAFSPVTLGRSLDMFLQTYDSPNIAPILVSVFVFRTIGHCLFSWLFALVAGWAAAAMYVRRTRELASN